MKEKLKELLKKKVHVNWITSTIIIIIYAFFLTIFLLLFQPSGVGDLISIMRNTKGLAFVLNFIPILLLNLILFFAFNNLVLSSSIVGTIIIIFSFVNRYKIVLRQDPFLPWDILLFKEAFNIVQSISTKMVIFALIGLLLILIFTIICHYFIKNKIMNTHLRITIPVILFFLSFYINKNVYKDVGIFNSLHVVGNIYNQVDNFNSKGVLYSFIYTANTNKMAKFDGYDKDKIENEFKKELSDEKMNLLKEKKYPNVFMIMGEAYSDITETPLIDFENFVDPMENFQNIIKESISGDLIVPGLGGGTADTEFDVLTGDNTRFFRTVPFTYRMVNKNMNSLATILSKVGYGNIALSPSHSWFYNRENVFRHFGFKDYIHLGYFEEEMFKGQYVSEENTFNEIINQFETHRKNSDSPFYNFTVTIQNHGPYGDKYQLYDVKKNFNTTADLTDKEVNELTNYIEGAIDADRELLRIKDYCDSSDEPMVLVYFGDHIPGFSQGIYEKLVDDDSTQLNVFTNRYRVPYLIWQNDASKKLNDFDNIINSIPIPEHKRISSFYLYSMFLKLMELDEIDNYTELSLDLMEKYPIMLEYNIFDAKGNYYLYEDIEQEDINNFKNWQYYKVFDENN